jgi:DNA phosphorothioation-associated putative methyltransferase
VCDARINPGATIPRYRTAIRRYSASKPIARAMTDGLIARCVTVFDYGCGRGTDLLFLRSRRIKAEGWDPYYRSSGKVIPADVVNLGYVLNVIEDPSERDYALRRAYDLAGRLLIVAVRIDQALDDAEEFGDGFCTGKGTFQKLYTQTEFRDYLQSTLGVPPLFAVPGIAYLFKDEELKSWYLANRAFTRRLEYRADLIAEFGRSPLAARYVESASRLGRLPLPEELPGYERLLERFGSPKRLERLVLRRIDRAAYEGSRAERRADILTYLAMLRLEGLRLPPFHVLPASIQADVKAFWGSYASAASDGERFLFSMGNQEAVRKAASEAKVGKLLPEDHYVHRSGVDELPTLLRLIVFAATRVVGEVEYDVVKISLHGRSVSFLRYPNFDNDPHPALLRSVRVYLPRATYSVREYDESPNPPILHRKDALVPAHYPQYEIFRRLTTREEELGLLGEPNIGYRQEWEAILQQRGFVIKGHDLVGT